MLCWQAMAAAASQSEAELHAQCERLTAKFTQDVAQAREAAAAEEQAAAAARLATELGPRDARISLLQASLTLVAVLGYLLIVVA